MWRLDIGLWLKAISDYIAPQKTKSGRHKA